MIGGMHKTPHMLDYCGQQYIVRSDPHPAD
jgi:hypothetical protein